jgi:hypothetical protein
MDVLRRRSRWRAPSLATALSRWRAGTDHTRPNRGARHSGRAGWLTRDFHRNAAKQPLGSQRRRGPPAYFPKFARDSKFIYYERRETPGAGTELARIDLDSGRSETVLPGVSVLEYDISNNGKEVVFSQQPHGAASQIWLAALDRSSPPKLIASSGETSPYFGPDGKIIFRLTAASSHYLARMNRDGSEHSRIVPYPIGNITSVSPDRCWVLALTPRPEGSGLATIASPVCRGVPARICRGPCFASWDPSGGTFYIELEAPSGAGPGKTLAIPVPTGKVFPILPDGGFTGHENLAEFPGSRVVAGWAISPGPDPSIYAYVKTSMQRNLFRMPM